MSWWCAAASTMCAIRGVEGVGQARVQVVFDLVVEAAGVEAKQPVVLGEVEGRFDLVDLPGVGAILGGAGSKNSASSTQWAS